jgi:hypothetical protein
VLGRDNDAYSDSTIGDLAEVGADFTEMEEEGDQAGADNFLGRVSL